jgi:hypothetical protein
MTIHLPKDWTQVTLAQYIGLADLNEMEGSEEERVLATIALMADIDIEDVRMVRMADLGRLMGQLQFLKDPIQGKVSKSIPLRWKRYKIAKDAHTMTAGQYIDINYFLTNKKAPANFADIMAVLMQPTKFMFWTRKKKPMEHEAIKQDALNLPMTIVKPLADFFLSTYNELEKNTADYSLRTIERELKRIQDMIALQDGTTG